MAQLKGWTKNLLLAGGTLLLLFILWYFSTLVTYILISVVISFLGRPFMHWFSLIRYRKFRIPEGVAAFLTLIILWALFFSFFSLIIPLVIRELEVLSQIDFEAVYHSVEEPLSKVIQFSGYDPVIIQDRSLTDILAEQLGATLNFSQIS